MDNDELFKPDTALLVPQADDFSCGPACFTTVSNLYDVDGDYHFFRKLLDPNPEIGTCPTKMARFTEKFLPVKSIGEDTYHGGIAIAYIVYEPPQDASPSDNSYEEDHYVVYLAEKNGEILYYDPYDHGIFRKSVEEIRWESEAGDLNNWSVNFKRLPGAEFEVWEKLMTEEF